MAGGASDVVYIGERKILDRGEATSSTAYNEALTKIKEMNDRIKEMADTMEERTREIEGRQAQMDTDIEALRGVVENQYGERGSRNGNEGRCTLSNGAIEREVGSKEGAVQAGSGRHSFREALAQLDNRFQADLETLKDELLPSRRRA